MTEKVINYTDEAVARLHEVYDGEAEVADRDVAVKALADELGKSTRSIVAKLTREGIYVPKGPAPKKGAGVSKAALVTVIAARLNVDEDVIGSLEKANKDVLTRIAVALAS